LPQSRCSSPLPLGMATPQCKSDFEAERREKQLYLHSQFLVCIYSSTIKNSRVSQLTFGKAHKTLLFCLLLWKACGGESMFDESIVLNLQMWNCVMAYASMLVLKNFVVNTGGSLGSRNSFLHLFFINSCICVLLKRMESFHKRYC
jgi:hypothetical protein